MCFFDEVLLHTFYYWLNWHQGSTTFNYNNSELMMEKKKPSFSQFLEFRTWMSFLRALHSLYNLILTSLSLASHLSENKVPTFPRKYASLTKNPSLNHDTIIFSIQFIKPSQILLNITITHLIKKRSINMQFPSYMHHLKKTAFHYNPQKCAKLCIYFN